MPKRRNSTTQEKETAMGKMTDCQDRKSQPTLHVVSIASNAEGRGGLVELTNNKTANDGLLLLSQPTAKQTSLPLMGQSASADARPSHTQGFSRLTPNPGQWEGKGRTACLVEKSGARGLL